MRMGPQPMHADPAGSRSPTATVAGHGAARRQEHRGHRRAHRRLARLRASPGSPSAEGAEIVLTGAGRALSLTQRTARKLPATRRRRCSSSTSPCPSTSTPCATTLAPRVGPRRRRAARHRLRPAVAARRRLHGRQLGRRRGRAAHLDLLAEGARRRLRAADDRAAARSSGSTSTTRVAWPAYNWMGVAKSALQSVSRYLATRARAAAASAATSSPPARCARWRPRASPGSPSSRTSGTSGRRSAGTSTIPSRSPRRASRCCRTGSRPRRARSSTSTAGSTRRVPPGGRAGQTRRREPARRRDVALPPPAPRQPGRLVPVGARGLRRRRSSATCRSCCRSATRRATGAT